MCYNLLSYVPVFYGKDSEQVLRRNRRGFVDVKMLSPNLSSDFMDLLAGMFDLVVPRRLSAVDALAGPVFGYSVKMA